MQGCIAPSEIPGISSAEASIFGQLAENLIYMDFLRQHPYPPSDIFVDSNNPAAYLYFLASRYPHFSKVRQMDFYARLADASLMRVPDILVDSFADKVFYEIKPDSATGRAAGVEKVGILSATYKYYKLPFIPGEIYFPAEIITASFGNQLTIKLKARLLGPGLIVYKLCLESGAVIDTVILAAILRYVVKKMNEQNRNRSFRPVDLKPAFSYGELSTLAAALGLAMGAGAAAAVGWRFFWLAVKRRFAIRAATAAVFAGADGPLPIGDLVAAGISIFTIFSIIRHSDELWREAAEIQKQGA